MPRQGDGASRCWSAPEIDHLVDAENVASLGSGYHPLTALVVLDASALEVGMLVAAGDLGWLLLTLPAGSLATHLPLRGHR